MVYDPDAGPRSAADPTTPEPTHASDATERVAVSSAETRGGPPSSAPTAPSPADADDTFVKTLRGAGLLSELDPEELGRISPQLTSNRPEERQLDLLELYYAAGGDATAAARRVGQDRFFVHRDDSHMGALEVLRHLESLFPELGELRLERIGDEEGPLVLRSSEHISPLVDAYEEELDTDEVDLRDMEQDQPMVSVHSLVGGLNGLLSRHGVRARLVELRSDGRREVYVASSLAKATSLLQHDLLEDEDAEELMDFAGW